MLLQNYKIFLFTLSSHYNSVRWNLSWTNLSLFNKKNNDWRHVNILRERHESCFVKVNRFVDRERADNSGPPYGHVESCWAIICIRPADMSTPACSLVCLVLSTNRCRFLEQPWRETTTLSAEKEITKRRRSRRLKEEK